MISTLIDWVREQFPALTQEINGQPVIFFDGPGGTQLPISVVESMSNYLLTSNANAHGAFATSARTDTLVTNARRAIADFLGCNSDEVVFGANMTTLTFALSRAIGRQLQPGDEIVVTQLDHDSNVSPWRALEEKGVTVSIVRIKPDDCTLDMNQLAQLINQRTRLVAVGYASNAVGTINDIKTVVHLAHQVGALVFVDAVHYAPHGSIDVRALNCDFLACSAYKFFGPHVGILYGKREHLRRFHPYKLRPAPDEVPSRWETGTQNFEGLAGLVAAIDYLAGLGYRLVPSVKSRREALITAMDTCQQYETQLCKHLVAGLLKIPGLTLYGITDLARFAWRTPTVAIRLTKETPYTIAKTLGEQGIFTWHGNFYALGLTEKLGVEESGGLLRIGIMHYNTIEEIDRLLEVVNAFVENPAVNCTSVREP
jgi:cysteine desulfurase family protein (TIGR01976 family)